VLAVGRADRSYWRKGGEMARKKEPVRTEKEDTRKPKEERHVLTTSIDDDQREYIENVRRWLHDSLARKGKVVGGPIV
jgi:hypothetical protein